MLKNTRKSSIRNEKGMAALEMIPIIVVVVLFLNFSLGFFGAVHTGILNSIAARNYTFETFRHRSNLTYFRNIIGSETDVEYSLLGMRVHGTVEGTSGSREWIASSRSIDFFEFNPRAAEAGGGVAEHNNTSWDVETGKRFEKTGVNPIWVKTQYGICLNATCGG